MLKSLPGEREYPGRIESLSDLLDIVNRPQVYLRDILDVPRSKDAEFAPLQRSHYGAPRPFPHGIWFRGQPSAKYPPIPSVFREEKDEDGKQHHFINEREMFSDLRLRASNIDLRGFNNLELMCIMQNHRLPTRLMDWSESPLVAAFFAAEKKYYERIETRSADKYNDMAILGEAANLHYAKN